MWCVHFGLRPVALCALLLLGTACDGQPEPVPDEPAFQDVQEPAVKAEPRNGDMLTVDTGPQEDAAIRAIMDSYLKSVTFPDPPKLDPKCIATDVLAIWSDGTTHEGREAFMRALQVGIDEVAKHFETFEVEPERQVVRRSGTHAWTYSKIRMSGVLKDGKGSFGRTVHSTFVLEKRDDRWQIVHELSSRPE